MLQALRAGRTSAADTHTHTHIFFFYEANFRFLFRGAQVISKPDSNGTCLCGVPTIRGTISFSSVAAAISNPSIESRIGRAG